MKHLSQFALIMGAVFLSQFIIEMAKEETRQEEKIKTEYQLEILNQDSVKLKSLSTERIYIVPFDEVETVLLKDNL